MYEDNFQKYELKIIYFVVASIVIIIIIWFAIGFSNDSKPERTYLGHEASTLKEDIKPEIKEVIKEIPTVTETKPTPAPIESEERKKDRLETQKIFDDVKRQKEIHRMYEQQKESEREASDRIYKRTHKENTGSNQYEQECLARGSDSDVCKSLGILYDKGYR